MSTNSITINSFGCTLPDCYETFADKDSWIRHEVKYLPQFQFWICPYRTTGLPLGSNHRETRKQARINQHLRDSLTFCTRNFQDKGKLLEHLQRDHSSYPHAHKVEQISEMYWVGKNFASSFWCGHCQSIVVLSGQNMDGWDERFDHIDAHLKNGKHWLDWKHFNTVDSKRARYEHMKRATCSKMQEPME